MGDYLENWLDQLGTCSLQAGHRVITDVVSGQMGIWVSGFKPDLSDSMGISSSLMVCEAREIDGLA